MRISIKPHLTDYVTQIGVELEIDDPSEIVSVILLDHKRGLCRCSRLQLSSTEAVLQPSSKDPNEALADGLEDFLNSASY